MPRGGHSLRNLPAGGYLRTRARRTAQLLGLRHHLDVPSIRGNVDTWVRKVQEGEFDAVVLAAAGVVRLGLEEAVNELLDAETMLLVLGQGALGVQCRDEDERILGLLAAIDDPGARAETTAERVFLLALCAGCTAPVGARAQADAAAPSNSLLQSPIRVRMKALVASPDGRQVVRVEGEGDPEEFGVAGGWGGGWAGAGDILDAIRGAQPLAGRRIVLTRPRDQAGSLAEALERLGAAVLAVPLVDIEPIEDARASSKCPRSRGSEATAGSCSISANGVAGVRDRLGGRAWPNALRVAAVGPATADAVRTLGVEAAFVPLPFPPRRRSLRASVRSRACASCFRKPDIASPSSRGRALASRVLVDAVAAYRTCSAIEPSPGDVGELARGVDAIVVASGSAARSLVTSRIGTLVQGAVIVCIGPKTAQTAREVWVAGRSRRGRGELRGHH